MIFKRSFKPDRRRRKRQLLNAAAQVFADSVQADARAINLSNGGMRLFAVAKLSVGAQIQVEFLPFRDAEPVRTPGIVCYRALYLYGIEFLLDSSHRSTSPADAGIAAGESLGSMHPD